MSAKPTTNLLVQLRDLMKNPKHVREPIHAYIVPTTDAHNTEYLADCDKFREFISGFTGSVGTAIITETDACLWTDGRYYLQASQELDYNWTLMKDGLATTPTPGNWLSKVLPVGSRIGVDPNVITFRSYLPLHNVLKNANHKMVPVATNLISLLWTDRPPRPANPVIALSLRYSGCTVKEKFKAILLQMKEKGAKYMLLTALDDIAWFLNLRGSDIAFNPLFFSYVIIGQHSIKIFMNTVQVTPDILEHLGKECHDLCFQFHPYEAIDEKLKDITADIDGFLWCSDFTNYKLVNLIPKKCLLLETTPIGLMKAIKNPTEVQGMRNAHIKDAAAVCSYFSWLEKVVETGKITEISGADKLEEFRSKQDDFMGLSFETINGVGPHGSIIHYKAVPSSDVPITTTALYLCDSGGQYLDGTTDITRTMHFGTPTNFEKECFTRVLKGQIKIATSIFPAKTKGHRLDAFARDSLWEIGLDYAHGTGHGIGSFLCVHEGPLRIGPTTTELEVGLEAGMFISNEPGYYQDGDFGIRLEDVVEVVKVKTPHNFVNRGYLGFRTITLVPKQTKMIVVNMLTDDEIAFINNYHQCCRDIVGPLLEKQGAVEAKKWLWRETEPISRK